MKKYLIALSIFFISLTSFSQDRNPSQFVVGLSYGLPVGDQTKALNNNIFKISLGQEFSLSKFFSLNALGDFATTTGVLTNPNINKVGLGGGIKIQIVPIVNLIRKNKLNTKLNIFVNSNGSININNIKNYAGVGEIFNLNILSGIEFFGKEKRIYKIYLASDYFFNDYIDGNLINSQTRIFSQIGFAIGFNNSKKK